MVARRVSEPPTANWLASEADWTQRPTKHVFQRLVDDGPLHRNDTGGHTTYVSDYRRREIAREWEPLQWRLEIVGFAIREWGSLS
jgi:hypothetical protein